MTSAQDYHLVALVYPNRLLGWAATHHPWWLALNYMGLSYATFSFLFLLSCTEELDIDREVRASSSSSSFFFFDVVHIHIKINHGSPHEDNVLLNVRIFTVPSARFLLLTFLSICFYPPLFFFIYNIYMFRLDR